MLKVSGYTVIDVETTGLFPEMHDRIVEIGVVYLSHDGQIQDHWTTLVNPERDVGPTRIHGITPSDVVGAPTFAELAPYVLRAVSGRIVVAHNADFDLRFLAHELQRAGVPLSQLPLQGLCTMAWSEAYLRASSRRLVDCCRACGVTLTDTHTAGSDALATAGLLQTYLRASAYRPPWGETLSRARSYPWPQYTGNYPELSLAHREHARARREDQWLDRIISRMPRAADSGVESYLAVLEMALIDGFLAEHEKDSLVEVASAGGLTRGQVLDVHGAYLQAMAVVAWEDGVVTAEERHELDRVGAMLGLRGTDVDAALAAAAAGSAPDRALGHDLETAGIRLAPGDRVVFTGDMLRERSEWEAIARAHGLDPGGVTKKTKVLVAADPNSLSGKAGKARGYGVPIITEAAFAKLLGVNG
jgi:DNA polymerase-3 subunit epsilon